MYQEGWIIGTPGEREPGNTMLSGWPNDDISLSILLSLFIDISFVGYLWPTPAF